jgi:hypothetical protein
VFSVQSMPRYYEKELDNCCVSHLLVGEFVNESKNCYVSHLLVGHLVSELENCRGSIL